MKNTVFVGPKDEAIYGLELLLNQITQWCDYIEEVTKITKVNPNNNSESSASLNQSRFHLEFEIYHYQNIKLGLFFLLCHKNIPLMSTLDQSCV